MQKSFDEQRLKEMILYISKCCADQSNFSETRLRKILFHADFLWFGRTGKSMSGETYFLAKPAPLPQHFDAVRDKLAIKGVPNFHKNSFANGERAAEIQDAPAKFRRLSTQQMAFIDEIIVSLKNDSAPNWENSLEKTLQPGGEIPYQTVFFSQKQPLSKEEIEQAQAFVDAYEKRMKERRHAAV